MRVVCKNGADSLAFERPARMLVARDLDDVQPVFEAADRAVRDGSYVAGFVGYEAGAAFVPRQRMRAPDGLPLVALGIYRAPKLSIVAKPNAGAFALGALVPAVSRARYDADVADILARIRAGTVYQVNYAAPFSFAFAGNPYALFAELTHAGAFPYSAFVETDAYAIVSCSPELFVRFDGTTLTTKPMKGTATADDPAALASAKNRAEHVMIVDLLRNDMHRLSDDVVVARLADIERYPSFATMTSTIEARRERPFTLAETFAAMFPCGSITGAPKMTAMHAIAELEGARGAFCGSIGYRGPDGIGTWNVAIRTATIDRERDRGVVNVGGGIVADSVSRDEWAEILLKRRFIDRVAPTFRLIETLRRESNGDYRNLDAHLARLAASADALHFVCDEARVRATLTDVSRAEPSGDLIVRIALDCAGDVVSTTRAFADASRAVVVLSRQCVDPRDPPQRHKTDYRPQYAAAFTEARARDAFDALLCTSAGYVADGSRTNVFVDAGDGGPLRTPSLEDGPLPGILRAQLLANGDATESRLTVADLANAHRLYVGNSARGLLRVRFEP